MAERTPDDAEWERIVASLRGPDTQGSTDWPVDTPPPVENDRSGSDEAVGEAEPDDADPSDPPRVDVGAGSGEPVIIWRGSSEDVDAELDRAIPDEHFVPPDPPPLPRADAITWAAWFGVLGAPLLLLLLTAVGVSSRVVLFGCIVAFLGGLGVLVARMRTHHDPFDPDDGAVV